LLSVGLTFAFVGIEIFAGWRAHSLGLISDGVHNFTDGFSLILSWYALHISQRPANARNTFGYQRAGILAALINAFTLVGSSIVIIYEAVLRLRNPEPVESGTMMVVAVVAVGINSLIAWWLHKDAHHDMNMRGAYLHMVGDALFSVGVIVAGAVIRYTGWLMADPLIAVLIGGYIGYSSLALLRDSAHILMEGTPKEIDVEQMLAAMRAIEGVENVHHLHVWTLAEGHIALSCHIRLQAEAEVLPRQIVQSMKAMLAIDFSVHHSTIETECEACNSSTLYCNPDREHFDCNHAH
jgi:cobalt-zinc-cadmium efflux system protein